jgi:hypothetical protein
VAAAQGLDHLGPELAAQPRQHGVAVDPVAGGRGLRLEQLDEARQVDLAALQAGPGVGVGVGGVEPADQPRREPGVGLVASERLERAREDDPAEVEDDRAYRHRIPRLDRRTGVGPDD